eukprot:5194623-Amphidinium_carterae.4
MTSEWRRAAGSDAPCNLPERGCGATGSVWCPQSATAWAEVGMCRLTGAEFGQDLEAAVSFAQALPLEPITASVHRGGLWWSCEVEGSQVVGNPVCYPLIARQDLSLALAQEHTLVYQPITDGQCGARAVPHQRGSMGGREFNWRKMSSTTLESACGMRFSRLSRSQSGEGLPCPATTDGSSGASASTAANVRARAQSLRRAGNKPIGRVPIALGKRTTAVLKPVHSSDSSLRTNDASSCCKAGPSRVHDGKHQSSRPAGPPPYQVGTLPGLTAHPNLARCAAGVAGVCPAVAWCVHSRESTMVWRRWRWHLRPLGE